MLFENIQLAQTFPQAKARIKALCQEDKKMIREFNELKAKLKGEMIRKGNFSEEALELILLKHSTLNQHIINTPSKYFNEIITAEERLQKNEEILKFISQSSNLKNSNSGLENFQEKLIRAKSYPIDNLLNFNRAGFSQCIFHLINGKQERTASLKYYKKDNRVHCFGCGRNADTIDIIKERDNFSFKEAVNFLSNL